MHRVYSNKFGLFEYYDSMFNISGRLGYKNVKTAWKANPNYTINLTNNKLTKISKIKKK